MGDKRRLLEDEAQYPPTPRSEGRLVKGSRRSLLAKVILLPFAAIAQQSRHDRTQSPSYTALQRSWTLAECAFWQSASIRSRSVNFASPYRSMSFATL